MWHVGSLVQLVQLVSVDCLLQLVSFNCLIACVSLCYVFVAIFLLQSLGLNIVCIPPSIYRWICVLHSTLLLRNTQLMEEHNLYWPSKLFAHFGNRCQWGRSFREFCGEVQRVISSCFGFVPKHLHLILLHHWLLHCMVMHNSLYKLS